MESPEKLATYGTEDEEKQTNTALYVLDTTMRAALSLFLCAFFLLPFLLPFVLLFLFSLSVVDNRVGVVDRGIFIVVENCFLF
jgi:hypothetical protein